MIERVYIDNYKCFVNFELQPQAVQLILGGNGSGKTTLFDVLESVRDFLTEGNTTSQSFPASTLTAWDKRRAQTFELGIKGNDGVYQYRLVVEHEPKELRRTASRTKSCGSTRRCSTSSMGRTPIFFVTTARPDRFSRWIGLGRASRPFPNDRTTHS